MYYNFSKTLHLNFERSEECIDFTVIITSRNNAPISNYGGGFRCKSQKLTFSNSFQKNQEKQKKNDGKTGILRKTSFRPNRFFFYGCNSKTNHCKYLKFSPNIYVSLNFHKILTFFDVDNKFLDDQKVLKI
ncbi:Uncharacterized protein FWK35_00031849 [Aphis craccivora]|uniref:Uncharacterized protein n=1 Tax=Aphis craccivora TaxID=307492 RepID=A0A6G0W3Z9_APHCR|nr:Uncharacterized protein FWK35_00031849 [Aphis craccivora]